jgi:hypothetical protein
MMSGFKPPLLIALSLIAALVSLTSCSTGPAGPKPGTPEFYWQAAKDNFAKKNYTKTTEHLAEVVGSDSEALRLAAPMALVLNAGLASGYAQLAEDYETGAKTNTFKPMPLRKVGSDYLKQAERRAIAFAEAYMKFKSNQDATVTLDFAYPGADMSEIHELKKIVAGSLPDDSTRAAVESKMLEQSVALSACAAVGAFNDPAKAQAVYQAGNVQVPKDVFLLAMANNLYEEARLFTREKLSLPERLELFASEAVGALKQVKTPSKESKDLQAKLDKLSKTGK